MTIHCRQVASAPGSLDEGWIEVLKQGTGFARQREEQEVALAAAWGDDLIDLRDPEEIVFGYKKQEPSPQPASTGAGDAGDGLRLVAKAPIVGSSASPIPSVLHDDWDGDVELIDLRDPVERAGELRHAGLLRKQGKKRASTKDPLADDPQARIYSPQEEYRPNIKRLNDTLPPLISPQPKPTDPASGYGSLAMANRTLYNSIDSDPSRGFIRSVALSLRDEATPPSVGKRACEDVSGAPIPDTAHSAFASSIPHDFFIRPAGDPPPSATAIATVSSRDVFMFARTLEDAGTFGREFARTFSSLTGEDMTHLMHWGIIVGEKVFELKGLRAGNVRFGTKEADYWECKKHHMKEFMGRTNLTDVEIMQIGEEDARELQGKYELFGNNCQMHVNRVLRQILIDPSIAKMKKGISANRLKEVALVATPAGRIFLAGVGAVTALKIGSKFAKEAFGFD